MQYNTADCLKITFEVLFITWLIQKITQFLKEHGMPPLKSVVWGSSEFVTDSPKEVVPGQSLMEHI